MHEGKNVDAVSSPLARDLADRRELLHAGEAGRVEGNGVCKARPGFAGVRCFSLFFNALKFSLGNMPASGRWTACASLSSPRKRKP